MSRIKRIQEKYEPDPAKICEHSFTVRKSEKEAELILCEKLADYRVLLHLGETLIESGDASNPKDWSPEHRTEYYCRKHFDQIYRYAAPPTPKLTFRKIVRPQ